MIWRKERNRREIYTQRSNEQSYTEGYNVRKHDENETEEGKMCKYTVPLRHMAPFPTLSSTFPLPNIIIAQAEKIIRKKEETKKKRGWSQASARRSFMMPCSGGGRLPVCAMENRVEAR